MNTNRPTNALDLARLREDFPPPIKDWAHMNLAERAAHKATISEQFPGCTDS